MARQFVFADSVDTPRSLRHRYRSSAGAASLLLPQRTNLDVGDLVAVFLAVRSHGVRLRIAGSVLKTACRLRLGSQFQDCFQLQLDPTSHDLIRPHLFDIRKHQTARRRAGRYAVSEWSDCRTSTGHSLRQAQVKDVSPLGLFLSTGVDCATGDTLLFKLQKSRCWLGGEIRWRGQKDGDDGVGVQLIFSRAGEAAAWHQWYAARVSAA